MKSIVDSVSQVIVSKLLNSDNFIAKTDGWPDEGWIKQNVHDACAKDAKKILTAVESLESRASDIDKENKVLRD